MSLQRYDERALQSKGVRSLSIPKTKPAQRLESLLVVALDCSGSMAANLRGSQVSKIGAAWSALVSTLEAYGGRSLIRVVTFGSPERCKWVMPPTQPNQLRTYGQPEADGSTPMLWALKEGLGFLQRRAERGRLVLISDGSPDESPDSIIDYVSEAGIVVDTIGIPAEKFGTYDPVLLATIARATGGLFYEVGSVHRLVDTLVALAPTNKPMPMLGSGR